MERADVISLLGRLKQAYPQAYAKMTRAEAEELVSLWSDMLGNEDPTEAMEAVNALIAEDTRGFPPKVGQVLAKIRGAVSPHVSVAWMKPYIERIAEQEEFMPSVSRYAREHKLTWEAAGCRRNGRVTHGASSFIYRGRKACTKGQTACYAAWDIHSKKHADFRGRNSRGMAQVRGKAV